MVVVWTAEAGGSLLSNGSVHLRIKNGGAAPAPPPSPLLLATAVTTSPPAGNAGNAGGGGGRGEGRPAATLAAAEAEASQPAPAPLLGSAEWVGPLGRHDDGRSPYFKLGMCASLLDNGYESTRVIAPLLCLLTRVNVVQITHLAIRRAWRLPIVG